jgi:hypothetical protein
VPQSGNIVPQFTSDLKEYVDLATGIPNATALPNDKRRNELETLVRVGDAQKTREEYSNPPIVFRA